jgi:hypothetical protein
MANPAVYASGTATPVSIGTEYDFSAPNALGTYVLVIDTNALASGDVLEIRVYKMVLTSGTSRVMYVQGYYGVQATDDQIKYSIPIANDLTDSNAVRFTYKQTFGTQRAIPWKVFQYT